MGNDDIDYRIRELAKAGALIAAEINRIKSMKGGMMESEELKPCPFCGSEAWLFEGEGKEFFVYCTNHDCNAEGRIMDDRAKAVRRWNRRVPNDAQQKDTK